MTALELLPRKVFEITLEDGSKIQGQFGTWALKRFTDKKKIGLQQIAEVFNSLTLSDAVDFVLCAIEYKQREAKKPLMSDMGLCAWADAYAEENNIGSGSEVLANLIVHASSESDPGEKKSDQNQEALAGETSQGTEPQPE